MFNIGSGEMVLLFVVALMIFGPQRLPEMGRAVGEAMSSFRKAMQSLSEPLVAEVHSQTRQLRETPAAPPPAPAITPPSEPSEPAEPATEAATEAATAQPALAETPSEPSKADGAPIDQFEPPVPMTAESPS